MIYCASFFFLIFDTFIGLFQLINLIQRGGGLITTARGQFMVRNVILDVLLLIGMSLYLLTLWRKLFVEEDKKPISSYSKLFKIFVVIGGICLFSMILLFTNPFFIEEIDLNVDPVGHLYDTLIKTGLIFFLLGIAGIASIKREENKLT